MDPLLELARRYGLTVIEDAAEAHGGEYKERKCGGLGHLSCFSFYANKIVTTGEGGMVLTNNEEWANKLRSLRNLCFKKERRFFHTELGHNYRMTNIQAAIGLAQVERIEDSVARKRHMASRYALYLADIPGLQLPSEEIWAKNVYWMYGIVLDESYGFDAKVFAERLDAQGVMTRPFFLGMHEQPAFRSMGLFEGEHYPVTERIARQGLYLPSGMTLTEEQFELVCTSVRRVLGR